MTTPTQPNDPIEGIDELIRDITRVGFAAKSEVRERLKKMIGEAYSLGQHAGLSGNIKNLDSVTVTSEIPQSIYNAIFEKGRIAGVREVEKIISEHNARVLNEFQKQGTADMPLIAYDERVCLVPAIQIATKETKFSLTNLLSLHE